MAHQWENYLTARREVIEFLNEEGFSDSEIAQTLAVNTGQVKMIRISGVDDDFNLTNEEPEPRKRR